MLDQSSGDLTPRSPTRRLQARQLGALPITPANRSFLPLG
jgi:hypothetical protein